MNQTTSRPARAAAVQRQQEAIDQNVAKIEEGRRAPPSALQIMGTRLNVPPQILKDTLINTVWRIKDGNNFRAPTDAEFVALVVVANEYKLNPLTKEIYAYPAKGGGIVPIVSIDGWLRIINEHPMMDGMEHNDIPDEDGKLLAIETVIYRKDRSRPIKVIEYLSECKQNTDPWRNMPARMLRHKSTIQGGRYAFGFGGIYSEDDDLIGDIGFASGPMPMRDVTPQRREEPREPARPAIRHDPATGEIEESEEEVAARLDRETYASMGGSDGGNGPAGAANGEVADGMIAEINRIELVADVDAYMRNTDLSLLSEDDAARVEEAADRRSAALRTKK